MRTKAAAAAALAEFEEAGAPEEVEAVTGVLGARAVRAPWPAPGAMEDSEATAARARGAASAEQAEWAAVAAQELATNRYPSGMRAARVLFPRCRPEQSPRQRRRPSVLSIAVFRRDEFYRATCLLSLQDASVPQWRRPRPM